MREIKIKLVIMKNFFFTKIKKLLTTEKKHKEKKITLGV